MGVSLMASHRPLQARRIDYIQLHEITKVSCHSSLAAANHEQTQQTPLAQDFHAAKLMIHGRPDAGRSEKDINHAGNAGNDEMVSEGPSLGSAGNSSKVRGLQRTKTIKMAEDDEFETPCIIAIQSMDEEHGASRMTILKARNEKEGQDFIQAVNSLVAGAIKARARETDIGFLAQERRVVGEAYASSPAQACVAVMICAAFLTDVSEAQLRPQPGSDISQVFFWMEVVSTVLFAVEISLILFSEWFLPFFKNIWNLWDLLVVLLSITSVTIIGTSSRSDALPGLSVLRLFRLFKMVKMVKVFQRLSSLRIILAAISNSLKPVAESMLIILLVGSVYSILATQLFEHVSPARFGSFGRSAFTLFQCATGDSWASSITRDLMDLGDGGDYDGNYWLMVGAPIFFVSFMLVVNIMLMNIVIAVLLDEFILCAQAEKERLADAGAAEARAATGIIDGPLDPVFENMLADFTSNRDLLHRIQVLWDWLDLDESGDVTLSEFNEGLKKLGLSDPIRLTMEEFSVLATTEHGSLLNKDLTLSRAGFEQLMLRHLRIFSRRKTALALKRAQGSDSGSADVLFGVKIALSAIDALSAIVTGEDKASEQTRSKAEWIIMHGLKGGLHRCFRAWKLSTCEARASREAKTQPQLYTQLRESAESVQKLERTVGEMRGEMTRLGDLMEALLQQHSDAGLQQHSSPGTTTSSNPVGAQFWPLSSARNGRIVLPAMAYQERPQPTQRRSVTFGADGYDDQLAVGKGESVTVSSNPQDKVLVLPPDLAVASHTTARRLAHVSPNSSIEVDMVYSSTSNSLPLPIQEGASLAPPGGPTVLATVPHNRSASAGHYIHVSGASVSGLQEFYGFAGSEVGDESTALGKET